MKSVVIIAIAIVLLIPITAFAQTENITVKHWFISSYENGCSVDNQKSLEFYEKLTSQYLSKYDIHGSQDAGKCVRGIDVANNFEEFSSTLLSYDLPIIILDGFRGLDYTLSTDAFGHYSWENNQSVIIFSSLSPFIESDSGAWTLSHELSHFALHEKGYSQSVFVDYVHQKQDGANTCLKNDLSLNNCPDMWMTVKSPLGKDIKMMKIYTSESEPTLALEKLLAEMNNPPSQSSQTSDSQCFTYYLSKEYNQAISCYNTFLISNPSDTGALGFLGRSFEDISDYKSALNTFQKINQLEPNNINGLNGIARSYDSLGRCDKSISYYEQVLLIDPKDIEAKTFITLTSLLCPSTSVVAESQIFDIKPIFSNGFITKYEINSSQNQLKLSVSMDSGRSGEMQIVIPRELLDSKSALNDVPFKVSVGGKTVSVDEIATTDSERVIKFPVSSTTSFIIITGSESYPNAVVVPEFGGIAFLILTTSIILVIVSGRKFHVMK